MIDVAPVRHAVETNQLCIYTPLFILPDTVGTAKFASTTTNASPDNSSSCFV
jgi:hypothetical protein